jgi:hypothetical protein
MSRPPNTFRQPNLDFESGRSSHSGSRRESLSFQYLRAWQVGHSAAASRNVIRHAGIGAGNAIQDVIKRDLSALWIAAFTRFEAMEDLSVFQAELGDILERHG